MKCPKCKSGNIYYVTFDQEYDEVNYCLICKKVYLSHEIVSKYDKT